MKTLQKYWSQIGNNEVQSNLEVLKSTKYFQLYFVEVLFFGSLPILSENYLKLHYLCQENCFKFIWNQNGLRNCVLSWETAYPITLYALVISILKWSPGASEEHQLIMHSDISNVLNHICCVVTVCHQVRCMCWGHLGLFHRAIAHLNWYQMVWMGDSSCKFSQIKSTNMFSRYMQSGVSWYIIFMFVYITIDPKL